MSEVYDESANPKNVFHFPTGCDRFAGMVVVSSAFLKTKGNGENNAKDQ